MNRSSPSLSLIICSRNRGPQLSACLQALPVAAMQARHSELVLVDNASADDTHARMQTFVQSADLDVIVVAEPHSGLSNARNAGIRASSAPLLAFTDDDCYLDSDFIDTVIDRFESDSIQFAGGRILLHDPTDAMFAVNYDETPSDFAPYSVLRPGDIQGACMVVRRSVFETIGLFDPAIGSGTPWRFEDIDLVARAAFSGMRGAHCPEFVVHHHHRRKIGPELDALRRANAVARGAYYAKFLLRGHVKVFLSWMRFHSWRPRWQDLIYECSGALSWAWSALITRSAPIPNLPTRARE